MVLAALVMELRTTKRPNVQIQDLYRRLTTRVFLLCPLVPGASQVCVSAVCFACVCAPHRTTDTLHAGTGDHHAELQHRVSRCLRPGEQTPRRVQPSLEGRRTYTRSRSFRFLRRCITCTCARTQGIAANVALLVHKDDVITIIGEDRTLAALHGHVTS